MTAAVIAVIAAVGTLAPDIGLLGKLQDLFMDSNSLTGK